MAKKKTTAEILAQLRAETAAKTAADDAPAETDEVVGEQSEPEASESADSELATTAEPAGKPSPAPKSTADIMARLRAEAAGGGKAPAAGKDAPAKKAAAKKPAAKKPVVEKPVVAAKAAAPAVPGGEKLSVQEMLKAARSAEKSPKSSGEVVAEEEKVAEAEVEEVEKEVEKDVRPVRGKPAALRKRPAKTDADRGRRNALLAILMLPLAAVSSWFAVAWTFLSAATGAFTLALARFMMPNVLVEPPSQFKIGSPSDYPPGTVTTKWKSEFGVWVVHTEIQGQDLIYALFSICTHLGCTPNWLEGEQKFKCPCHGSGFYISGVNFEGPAPRPLERTAIRIAPDGMLEVDKSRKFQQELGQWDDPASFIELA